jgi:benzodiazapine receptor
MLGMATVWHAPRALGRLGLNIIGSIMTAVTPVRTAATTLVRHTTTLLINTVSTPAAPLQDRNAERGETKHDRRRQGLNLLLSITQFAAAILTFSGQFGDQLFYSGERNPLIVPADYAFSVWGVIFPASIAYGIYQALPAQRRNPLLRHIGWWTAFAFGCITLWSPSTLFDPIRYTVPLFFGALGGLIYALYQISQQRTLTRVERWLVAAPIGVYAAWCTVGTIANTSTSLFGLGYTDPLLAEQTWAIIMLLVGGAISSFMTTVSRGNWGYALTIIWAFIAIVVANVADHPNTPVALTAGGMAALVALALVRARTTLRS